MLRYTLYFLIALLTFGLGLIFDFNFFNNSTPVLEKHTKFELVERDGIWRFIPVKEFKNKEKNIVVEIPQFEKAVFKKPLCRDKRLLPVWKLLLKDKYFNFQSGEKFREPDCAKMFEILRFDLNQDGKKDLILRAKVSDLCGATGNCGFWIFEKKRKTYRKILSASDYWEANQMGDQIKKSKNKNYSDILLKSHFSSSDTKYSTYKFDGRKYVESKCQVSVPAYDKKTTSNLRWQFVSCNKYFENVIFQD